MFKKYLFYLLTKQYSLTLQGFLENLRLFTEVLRLQTTIWDILVYIILQKTFNYWCIPEQEIPCLYVFKIFWPMYSHQSATEPYVKVFQCVCKFIP